MCCVNSLLRLLFQKILQDDKKKPQPKFCCCFLLTNTISHTPRIFANRATMHGGSGESVSESRVRSELGHVCKRGGVNIFLFTQQRWQPESEEISLRHCRRVTVHEYLWCHVCPHPLSPIYTLAPWLTVWTSATLGWMLHHCKLY